MDKTPALLIVGYEGYGNTCCKHEERRALTTEVKLTKEARRAPLCGRVSGQARWWCEGHFYCFRPCCPYRPFVFPGIEDFLCGMPKAPLILTSVHVAVMLGLPWLVRMQDIDFLEARSKIGGRPWEGGAHDTGALLRRFCPRELRPRVVGGTLSLWWSLGRR